MKLSRFAFATLFLSFVSWGHCREGEWRDGERARPPMAAAVPSSRGPFERPWFPTPPPFDLPPPSFAPVPVLPPPDDGFEPPRRFFPRPPFVPFPPFSGPVVQPSVAAPAPAPSFEAPRYATPKHPAECFVLCLPRCSEVEGSLDRQCLRTCTKCCKRCKCVPFGSRHDCKCYGESMYHGRQCP